LGRGPEANPGIVEAAQMGTLDNPIANSNANQARSVLQANPNINVVFFAPYDEFAKGVKIAVDEAGMSQDMSIYSADVSTADIAAMREPGSAWKATVATNPAVVGEVSVRALAIMLTGGRSGRAGRRAADPDHAGFPQRGRHQEHGRSVGKDAAVRPCRCSDDRLDAAAATLSWQAHVSRQKNGAGL
jgi:ABC-type sugar transport system substrate-binding protein